VAVKTARVLGSKTLSENTAFGLTETVHKPMHLFYLRAVGKYSEEF